MKKVILYLNAYFPPLIWAGTIFLLSSQSTLPGPNEFVYNFVFKKLSHMFVYFGLYLLLYRGFYITHTRRKPQSISLLIIPLFITLVYAISDEIHQSFTPGRSATLRDIGYDSLGMFLAFLWRYRYV